MFAIESIGTALGNSVPIAPGNQNDLITSGWLDLYKNKYLPMASSAVRNAFAKSKISPNSVTHLIIVTCTGFFVGMAERLKEVTEIPANTRVHHEVMHGCHGFFPALDLAGAIIASGENSCVLIVCIELCSPHHSNSLFADAAAAVICTDKIAGNYCVRGENRFHEIIPDSQEMITWNIGSNGYEMGLHQDLPGKLKDFAEKKIRYWLKGGRLHRFREESKKRHLVALHPIGPKILDLLQDALDVRPDQIKDSVDIYKTSGNMSSATIPFILKNMLERENKADISAIGFGPGVTVCGVEIGKI